MAFLYASLADHIRPSFCIYDMEVGFSSTRQRSLRSRKRLARREGGRGGKRQVSHGLTALNFPRARRAGWLANGPRKRPGSWVGLGTKGARGQEGPPGAKFAPWGERRGPWPKVGAPRGKETGPKGPTPGPAFLIGGAKSFGAQWAAKGARVPSPRNPRIPKPKVSLETGAVGGGPAGENFWGGLTRGAAWVPPGKGKPKAAPLWDQGASWGVSHFVPALGGLNRKGVPREPRPRRGPPWEVNPLGVGFLGLGFICGPKTNFWVEPF